MSQRFVHIISDVVICVAIGHLLERSIILPPPFLSGNEVSALAAEDVAEKSDDGSSLRCALLTESVAIFASDARFDGLVTEFGLQKESEGG